MNFTTKPSSQVPVKTLYEASITHGEKFSIIDIEISLAFVPILSSQSSLSPSRRHVPLHLEPSRTTGFSLNFSCMPGEGPADYVENDGVATIQYDDPDTRKKGANPNPGLASETTP